MPTITTESSEVEQRQLGRPTSGIIARALASLHRFPLASKGVLAIFDQAIYSGTSFLTAVLVGRTTSPDQLGQYYLVLSIVLVIAGVVEQLVAAPYVVYSKRRQGRELAEYAGSVWAHFLIGVMVTVVGLFTAIPIVSLAGQSRIIPGLWALAVFTPLLFSRQFVRRFTFANLELKSAIALDAAVAALQLSALGTLGYFGLITLFRIFAVMGGACGVACVGWYFLSRPQLVFVRDRYLPDWRINWRFGKWALQTFVLGNTTPQLMLWIVSTTIGTAATGIFGACSNLIGMTYVILCGIDNLLTPQSAHAFTTGGVKELGRVLAVTGAFVAISMGAFCVLFLTTGDWLVVLAFGPQYRGTGAILATLSISALMTGLSIVAGNGLWAIDEPRSNFFVDISSIVITLLAAALLIHPFGALGAALASLAGSTSAAILRTITVIRNLSDHVPDSTGALDVAAPS